MHILSDRMCIMCPVNKEDSILWTVNEWSSFVLFVKAGYLFKSHFPIPCVFPAQRQILPVPITSFVTITYPKLTKQTYSALKKKLEIFAANIEIYFTFRIREFTTAANQISCVLAKFPNSLCFPWQGFLLVIFPVFPAQWVPWTGHIMHILSSLNSQSMRIIWPVCKGH